jgi:hypothetical protein
MEMYICSINTHISQILCVCSTNVLVVLASSTSTGTSPNRRSMCNYWAGVSEKGYVII